MHTFKEYLFEKQIIEGFLDEMANLNPDDTGIEYVIWVGEVGGQHGPRIKVSNTKGKMNSSDCFVMSVSKEPEVLTPWSCKLPASKVEDISDWIKENYIVLMKLWKAYESGTGSTTDLIRQLQPLK